MADKFFQLAGLDRSQVSLANAFRCRLKHSNHIPDTLDTAKALKHCTEAHWRPQEGTRLYVASGEWATRVLTGIKADFQGWRGYLLPYNPKVVSVGRTTLQDTIWTPGPQDPTTVLVRYYL